MRKAAISRKLSILALLTPEWSCVLGFLHCLALYHMSAYSPQKLGAVGVTKTSNILVTTPTPFHITKFPLVINTTMVIYLLTLPQEIRTMILLYLLRSPTGYITLHASPSRQSTRNGTLKIRPYNPEKPKSYKTARTIGLAILRTCKQLYAESHDIIWKENIVMFQFSRPILADDTERALARMLKYEHVLGDHLQNVEVCAFWLCKDNAKKALPALEFLQHCGGRGVLRRVTLRNVSVGREDGWNMCEQLYLRRFQTEENMRFLEEALRDAGGLDGYLRDVERRFVFDIDFECTKMDVHTLTWWKSVGVLEVPRLMKRLHMAFGGDFEVNGRVWMRNRVEVESMSHLGRV